VRLWDDTWVFAAGNNPLTEQIRNAVENGTKKFLTVWNLANKP
jgi:hypothetical protein